MDARNENVEGGKSFGARNPGDAIGDEEQRADLRNIIQRETTFSG